MINTTFVTGPRGCSKSTLVRLASQQLADDPQRFPWIDTSRCLANSRQQKTVIGKRLIELQDEQSKGIILPGDIVVDSVWENFQWIADQRQPFHILLAGSPRSLEELKCWLELERKGFVSFKVLLVDCTNNQVQQGVQSRIDQGQLRADQGPEEVRLSLEEYRKKTLPTLEKLPPEKLRRTHRSYPPLVRLRHLAEHIELPENVRARWIRRLEERSHPLRAEIARIEGVKQPAPQKRYNSFTSAGNIFRRETDTDPFLFTRTRMAEARA